MKGRAVIPRDRVLCRGPPVKSRFKFDAFEPFWVSAALTLQYQPGVGWDQGTHMSQNVYLRIAAEGRLFGLSPGDWTILVGGFALVALLVLLL